MKEEQKLPYKISEYIKNKFREDFLFIVRDIKDLEGGKRYFIEVSKDDYIHQLQFDETGSLINKDASNAFPQDAHDGPSMGEAIE
jgi:hypothetical protein